MRNVWEWQEYGWRLMLPKLFYRNVKYSWQRVTRGYCDKDLWNIDYWFLGIVPDMLKQFKETRNGSPGCLGEEYVDEDGISCNDSCHEEWDKILDEMIFLFHEMDEETCQNKGLSNKELDEYREECKNKAFALFSKWFYSLWD